MNVDKNTVKEIINYAANNPREVTAIIVAAITCLSTIVRLTQTMSVNRRYISSEQTYYDPSSMIHWDLKRKLSNNEKQMIRYRKLNGEDIYDILRQMNVLK